MEALQTLLYNCAISFDLPILEWIQENLQSGFLDTLMPIITAFGNGGIFWIACSVLLMFLPKTRRIGFGMAFALTMGLVVCNMILKPSVARIRPYDLQETLGVTIDLLIKRSHDFSFPSGHTIASFEACTVLMLGNKKLGIPATVLAILIAFSRLYLYVHYPTDVITSIVLGTVFGILGWWLSGKLPMKKGKYQA